MDRVRFSLRVFGYLIWLFDGDEIIKVRRCDEVVCMLCTYLVVGSDLDIVLAMFDNESFNSALSK